MKIIFGLGNPEKKYEKTYHNLGFIVADSVAERLNVTYKLKSALRCTMVQTTYEGEQVVLVKPTTYMNLSGECVKPVINYFKAELKDVLVIYDDVDVEIGAVRVRPHGSAGTHNGMRNIALNLGATDFPRVRVGTKRRNENIPMIDYVLSEIAKDEYDDFNRAIKKATDCTIDFIKGVSVDDLMCKYNAKD